MFNHTNTTTELSLNDIDTAVIPIGATEQFGPHLPMHLDTLIAELYGNEYGKTLMPMSYPCYRSTPRRNMRPLKEQSQ